MIEPFFKWFLIVFALEDAMRKKFSDIKDKLRTIYNEYRKYFANKAEGKPLVLFSYCFLLNPRLMTQSDFASFTSYLVTIVSSGNNFNKVYLHH